MRIRSGKLSTKNTSRSSASARTQNTTALRHPPPATFYIPYRQMDDAGGMTYEIRTHSKIASVLAGVRAAGGIHRQGLPLVDVRTQTEQIDATMHRNEFSRRSPPVSACWR